MNELELGAQPLPTLWDRGLQLEGQAWGTGDQLCQTLTLPTRHTEVSLAHAASSRDTEEQAQERRPSLEDHRHCGNFPAHFLEESTFSPQVASQ